VILRDFVQFHFFHCNCDRERETERRESFFQVFLLKKGKEEKTPCVFLLV